MTPCEKIKKVLSEYIDDMLDPAEHASVEEHLLQCPACMAELERLAAISSAIKGLPKAVPPADFADNVNKRIKTRSALDRFLKDLFANRNVRIPVTIMATVLIVITLAKTTDIYYTKEIRRKTDLREGMILDKQKALNEKAVSVAAAALDMKERAALENITTTVLAQSGNVAASAAETAREAYLSDDTAILRSAATKAVPQTPLSADLEEKSSGAIKIKTRLAIYKVLTKIALSLAGKGQKIASLAKDDNRANFTVVSPSFENIDPVKLADELKAMNIGSVDVPSAAAGARPVIHVEIEKT
ncbi:MAG: zf-HC2 domain-containing protein [Candidatus Omnitrophica bacterium]|nr:zf-HC2 domain-containing protein [Candidatus Omnitrophota bacterium]